MVRAGGKSDEPACSGLVFDIKRYAIHDGPGIRTTVFFKGCPLQCRWCHNPESWRPQPEPSLRGGRCVRCGACVRRCEHGAIELNGEVPVTDPAKCALCGDCLDSCVSGAREIVGRRMTVGAVLSEIARDVMFYDQSGGGATFSGGEPLLQGEFLLALLARCADEGIHTAVDTTCYAEPALLRAVADRADLLLCDVKHMDGRRHQEFTGVGNDLILENIRDLARAGKAMVIRVPIIPGFNDDAANLEATAGFVASLKNVDRVDVLAYNPAGPDKAARLWGDFDLMRVETIEPAHLQTMAGIFEKRGFDVKIGG